MFLSSVHPGITVDAVKKKVPWDLKVSPDLHETRRPKDEEIEFIRRNFPTESISKALVLELGLANMARKLSA